MPLEMLLRRVRADADYAALRDRLSAGQPDNQRVRGPVRVERFSALDAAKPALIAALHGELARPTILLVGRLARARQIADELAAWSETPDDVRLFPEADALPYERLPMGPEHLYERLGAMLALAGLAGVGVEGADGKNAPPKRTRAPLIVVTARGAMDRLMHPAACRAATWTLRVGERIRADKVIGEWVRAGYEPVPVVQGPGEFARRGGIIDIYPCGMSGAGLGTPLGWPTAPRAAYRIELWGNDIDSIRTLDPATQRSLESVDKVVIGPAHEIMPDLPEHAESLLAAINLAHLRERTRDEVENELRMLREGQAFPLLEHYRGLLGAASILDYLPPDGLLILDEPGAVAASIRQLAHQAEELAVDLLERGESPGRLPRPYWSWDEITPRLAATPDATAPEDERPGRVRLDLVLDPDDLDTAFGPAPSYQGDLPRLMAEASGVTPIEGPPRSDVSPDSVPQPARALVIVSQQAARLTELLAEATAGVPPTGPGAAPSVATSIVHGSLAEGWRNDEIGVTLLTDREIFGWAKVRRGGRRAGTAARERFLSDLEVGELIVHVDHGIGRYQGLTRIADPNRGDREYLDIAYADSGRLLIPVEHADRVTRFIGAGEAAPTLTKLGSGEWQRAKRRIRTAVQRIAKDLVELYARRELAEAPPVTADTPWQMELEASFPFLETPDQLRATAEVKEDLEQPRPMDRLLVGDVGYGKTEVALRAAFKVVMDGKQVAVLVPTTVLAQQHFNTFRERLAAFPTRVEMLSRFLTDKQARAVLAGLKDGSVDIVIGTHRLVQRDVEFKNLGLVILDEEQRFGVSHKERFKELRTEVHVLTLSATPIPRTLHLSLVGVRDLSMIQTPPEERLPIRTYVGEHDEGLVREAILRELDRGGQIYYVYNRVQTIHTVAARLAALVPEARIVVGHGQMDDEGLEDAMLRFANGDADVLVCTTIIEAGLDLPNVNTIIVSNAHQFGLSQLYQLRGRVGRSAARAYAYFLYPHDRQLTELAEKRLRAIFEATELGAGYRIALKDLEIRGAGNLLGVEQHGHISAVGFDLYCKLLGEAVEQLKALHDQAADGAAKSIAERVLSGALEERATAAVSLPLDASLPADYVTDDAIRLNLYQRLAEAREPAVVGALLDEVEDRFGQLPEPAMNLFYLADLRLSAAGAGVEEINVDGSEIVVRFKAARQVNATALSRAVGTQVRARANQVRIALGRGSEWLRILPELIGQLQPEGQQTTRSVDSPGS